jgi:hypothetical protein
MPSGDSGGGGGNGGPVNGGEECKTHYGGATLVSPKANVLRRLNVGDRLDVVVIEQNDRPILCADKGGTLAGAVSHKSALQIIKCINKGYRYVAVITKLEGADCTLDIRMETGP